PILQDVQNPLLRECPGTGTKQLLAQQSQNRREFSLSTVKATRVRRTKNCQLPIGARFSSTMAKASLWGNSMTPRWIMNRPVLCSHRGGTSSCQKLIRN